MINMPLFFGGDIEMDKPRERANELWDKVVFPSATPEETAAVIKTLHEALRAFERNENPSDDEYAEFAEFLFRPDLRKKLNEMDDAFTKALYSDTGLSPIDRWLTFEGGLSELETVLESILPPINADVAVHERALHFKEHNIRAVHAYMHYWYLDAEANKEALAKEDAKLEAEKKKKKAILEQIDEESRLLNEEYLWAELDRAVNIYGFHEAMPVLEWYVYYALRLYDPASVDEKIFVDIDTAPIQNPTAEELELFLLEVYRSVSFYLDQYREDPECEPETRLSDMRRLNKMFKALDPKVKAIRAAEAARLFPPEPKQTRLREITDEKEIEPARKMMREIMDLYNAKRYREITTRYLWWATGGASEADLRYAEKVIESNADMMNAFADAVAGKTPAKWYGYIRDELAGEFFCVLATPLNDISYLAFCRNPRQDGIRLYINEHSDPESFARSREDDINTNRK